MSDLVVSYVKEDSAVAQQIAHGLEDAGYETWYYERDAVVGSSWLDQWVEAVQGTRAAILLISHHSLSRAKQVTTEIDWVREKDRPLLPVLLDVAHDEIQKHQSRLAIILGTVVDIPVPADGVTPEFVGRLVKGLAKMRIEPSGGGPAEPGDIASKLAAIRELEAAPTTFALAESALRALAEEFPDAAQVQRHLGHLYGRSFRSRAAVDAFERAVELDPKNGLLRWELALAFDRDGRGREAVASLQRALDLGLSQGVERTARALMARLEGAPA